MDKGTPIPLPIGGVFKGFNPEQTDQKYSNDMNNVRPVDVIEDRVRLGQRPGLKRWAAQQIGGEARPIVEMGILDRV